MPSTLTVDQTSAFNLEFVDLAPEPGWDSISEKEHFVQFYEKDSSLIDSVSEFSGRGLRANNPVIIIATREHRQALREQLEKDGLDMQSLTASGRYMALDAAETLSEFMRNGSPDAVRFREVVGRVVAQAAGQGQVRAFGEMVALLWAEGNGSAAIELEELWNDLAKEYSFALFCAYPMAGFQGDCHGTPMAHICKAHTRVIPGESYSRKGSTSDERLRTITFLQQKAASLEKEIEIRKQCELDLARKERELRAFLENAVEGIHKVDSEGKILWANKAEYELLGYDIHEYVGRDIREFHADQEVIDDILARLKKGEKLRDCEARVKHKDGSILYVSINSSGLWENDQFSHTQCFTRDITERKRASELLEKAVAERTAQLQESMAALEAFSYSVSHDLRSPLRAMHAYAIALLDEYSEKLDEEALNYLRRIERCSLRMDMLIRDVLAYSKVAKDDIQLTPVALKPLILDLIHQNPAFEAAKQWIELEDLHTVLGHEGCLTQVFSNLIDNALKFVQPGISPRIRITSQETGAQIKVAVSDNGIGIAAEHHSRVFKIFGRVYPAKVYGGTGIGLAIVSKAIARMGGEVGFQSELNRGATFWFTLPGHK